MNEFIATLVQCKRAMGIKSGLITALFVFALTAPASAKTVETVAVTPTVVVTANPTATQGAPGSTVPLAINVANNGANITLSGEIGYTGALFTNSLIKSWWAAIEYQPLGGSWTPLAGLAHSASGYNPSGAAPITTGLSAAAVQVASWGVTYPPSGDPVVGTQIAGLNSARWNLTLNSPQTATKILQLLSSGQTSQLRLRTRIEATSTGLFGIQTASTATRSATFTQMMRSQSASATDVRVTATSPGGTQQFTSSSNAALASIAAGQSAALSGSVALPAISPKGGAESDAVYLNRLRAASAQAVAVSTSANHKAGGIASPYWWWIGESDPGYDLGPSRTITLPTSQSSIGIAVPIAEITKQGPVTIDPGTTADYEISVANSGDAAGTASVTDDVDGQPQASVAGFGQLAPAEVKSATHVVSVPANIQQNQLRDKAAVVWTDSAGNNYGPLSAEFTSTVNLDVTPPAAPQLTANPAAITNNPDATFSFTGEPGGVFKCRLDGAQPDDCLSPVAFLGLEDGSHTFSVWQVDNAGNIGSAAAYTWLVDTAPPAEPSLSGTPQSPTQDTTAEISFSGELDASFECQRDGGAWAENCTSPQSFSALSDATHTLKVRQTDTAGNTGDPATAEWVVDTTKPSAPTLNSTPDPLTRATVAGFGFAGEPGGTFQCRLDNAVFADCTNPVSYEDLAPGDYTFRVRQTDDAGNAGEPTTFNWTIDRTPPPEPTITAAPATPTNQTTAQFTFSGEPGGRFECSRDGAEFAACQSPMDYDSLSETSHTFSVRQIDDAENVGDVAAHVWLIDTTSPPAPIITSSPSSPTTEPEAEVVFSGESGGSFECVLDGNSVTPCESPRTFESLATGPHTFIVRQRDIAGNLSDPAEATWTVATYDQPDELPTTDSTSLMEQVDFLYAGDNPIQTGVQPGTIEPVHVAVLRGSIKTRDGVPIPGVDISVLNRPEFGHTITTDSGEYSMAVNGGGTLTVKYEKSGYLPVERQLTPSWLDYEVADDAILTATDVQATTVDTTGLSMAAQTVTSSPVIDEDGQRQAVLVIPPNTNALRRLPDGSTQPLTQLSIRQTEFTVGPNGEQAMPADLPGTSAYTYAMAITIDGLTAQEASQVEFSQPVVSYVNAVTDMPVGSNVPVGALNYATGSWTSERNGRVMKVLSATGGVAQVDVDGSGIPATPAQLAGLGIGAEEMIALGGAYSNNSINGDTPITRVPITRAGGVDYNHDKNIKGSAGPNPDDNDEEPDCPDETNGSIIECETQGLGEELPIAGTPYKLSYRSRRTAGRTAENSVTFNVTGGTVQSTLQRVLVKATVAGRVFEDVLPATPNQTYTFTWDGKDAYGRDLVGTVPLDFETGFVYPTKLRPSTEEPAFGRFPVGSEYPGVELTNSRREAVIWRGTRSTVGTWRAKNNGLGGWSLDVQHRYDPVSQTLIMGDGTQYRAEDVNGIAKTTVGNCPSQCPVGNPLPTSAQSLIGGTIPAMAATADGSIFASGVANGDVEFLKRVRPDGTVENIQDRGGPLSYQYPGGQSEATLRKITDLAEAPDGSVYFIGQNPSRNRVRIGRVPPNGPMEWVQPLWGANPIADGGKLSTLAPFDPAELTGLDVGKDGSIYITTTPQSFNAQATSRVWRILPTGEIDPAVGNGQTGDSADSGLARNLKLNYPRDVAVSDDGDLYVADTGNLRVLHVSPDGVAERVGYQRPQVAWYHGMSKLALAPDGRLYMQLQQIPTVWALELNGTVTVTTPNVTPGAAGAGQINGDGGPALQASYAHTTAIAVSPDGSLHLGAGGGIRTVTAPLPSYTNQELVVPSPGGNELYIFNRNGRHLRTVDAKTNITIRTFSYGANNLISAVTDGDGNVTTIERDAIGKPTAIEGPFGRRTTLLVDNSGDLRRFTQSSGREDRMNYGNSGLLAAMSFPVGSTSQFTYDSAGRLLRDEDATGGFKTLTRTDTAPGNLSSGGLGEYEVAISTAMGLESNHKVRKQWGGSGAEVKRVITYRDGRAVTSVKRPNGSKSVDTASGVHADTQLAGDPRFGMGSPFSGSTSVRTPSGRQLNLTKTRTVQMGSSGNKLDINSQTETTTINGRASTDLWQKITAFSITAPSAIEVGSQPAPTARQTFTSTTGRIAKTEQDAQGRVLRATLGGGLASAGFVYDARGRIVKAADGNRAWTVTYDTQGNVASATDPLGRETTYEYDADGRATAVIMPGARRTEMTYDLNGNIQSLTPPSRPAHLFAFDATDYATGVQTPQVGSENSVTSYDYDAEHKLTTVTRPDNQAIDLTYDSSNRLSQITQPQGNDTFTYNTNGTLATAHSHDGDTTAVTYDGPLPISQQHSGLTTATTAQTYDNDFRLTAATLNGAGINYTYDQDSLLTGVGAMSITRNVANGLPTATALGVTDQTITTNDHAEVQQVDTKVSGSSIFDAQYTRDDLGRVTTKSETTPQGQTTWAYLYDQAGRLAQATKDGQLFATYTYDLNGNPVATTDALGAVKLATTDNRDRLTTYGPETFTYNSAGELTTRTNTQTNAATDYTYNAKGQLTSATLPNGTTVAYKLDTAGNRLQVLEDGVVTKRYVYAPESTSPVAEVDASGNTTTRYAYAPGSNVPAYMTRSGVTYRFITDQLGSVRRVVNTSTGAVAQSIDYDPYGKITTDSNENFQPFGFASGLYDSHTGLTHFGAREYDPGLGRWTSSDPIGFGGGDPNLYGYVLGDPVNWVDPSGLLSVGGVGNFVTDHWNGIANATAFAGCMVMSAGACGVLAIGILAIKTAANVAHLKKGDYCLDDFLRRLALDSASTAVSAGPGAIVGAGVASGTAAGMVPAGAGGAIEFGVWGPWGQIPSALEGPAEDKYGIPPNL